MTEQQLSLQIWELAKQHIVRDLRFMTSSATRLSLMPTGTDRRLPTTDGTALYFYPACVILDFKEDKLLPARRYLHSTMHCLLGHVFERQTKNDFLWDLACDICVEKIFMDLDVPSLKLAADGARKEYLLELQKNCPNMTAQEVYNWYIDTLKDEESLKNYAALFKLDDHALWNRHKDKALGPGELVRTEGDEEDDSEEILMKKSAADEEEKTLEKHRRKKAKDDWKQLARELQVELQVFNKRYGKRAGRFLDSLQPITFEECDYEEFLRNFGAEEEVMKVSDDAFDLIYYMYGLRIYGNVPLIEPLEYSDDNRIKSFVIAIDTSGSVQGDIVQSFLQRTCDVLRQTGSFTRQVEIYIIQCDAEIQSVEKITDMDQLYELIPKLQLKGFGGTDFRPVFDYVKDLQDEKKLGKINGLLYFTDGVGTYPEAPPNYKTAFIFNRDDYISPNVPDWAIKAVLTTDNIRVLKETK